MPALDPFKIFAQIYTWPASTTDLVVICSYPECGHSRYNKCRIGKSYRRQGVRCSGDMREEDALSFCVLNRKSQLVQQVISKVLIKGQSRLPRINVEIVSSAQRSRQNGRSGKIQVIPVIGPMENHLATEVVIELHEVLTVILGSSGDAD